jgi:tetratricopeptide (TPR) repeat protein
MNATTIEELHERAASYYLQGDYASALEAWQTLLAHDTADERAREGVRLCQQLQGGDEVSVCTAGHSPFRAAATPVPGRPYGAAPATSDADVGLGDILDRQLDSKLGLDTGTPATAAGASTDDAFLDLSDLADVVDERSSERSGVGSTRTTAKPKAREEASGAPQVDASGERIAWQWTPASSAGSRGSAAPPVEDGADAELRRRVKELLAQATLAAGDDRLEDARRIISRVLILDEENEEAQQLLRTLESGPPSAESSYAPQPVALASLHAGPQPEDPPVAVTDQELEFNTAAPEGDFSFESVEEEPQADSPGGGPAGAVPDAVPAGLSVSTGKPLTKWSALTAALAMLLVGTVWGWRMLGAGEDDPQATPATTPEEEVAQMLAPLPAKPRDGSSQPAAVPSPAAAAQPADSVDRLLEAAATAMQARDYAAAVLAYNKVLRLEDAHPVARAGLERAASGYREQQELRSAWQRSIAAFEDAEYHEALRQFYRLDPDGRSAATVLRYKVNGWFNYGLQALSALDCKEAATRFQEAAGLAPDDEGVKRALALARACPAAGDPAPAFFQRLRSIERRQLDE